MPHIRLPLVLGIAAIVACMMMAGCQAQVERGAQKATEKKIDQKLYGGGKTGDEADAYAANITFEMIAMRIGEDEVRVTGIVSNNGNKTVTHLEVYIGLIDENGVQVAGRTDWFAHTLPFGENNTPLMPGRPKRVGCVVSNAGNWKPGKVDVQVLNIAIK